MSEVLRCLLNKLPCISFIIISLIIKNSKSILRWIGWFSNSLCLSTFLASGTCLFAVGERLETGIRNSLVLQSDEAVVLTAQEEFVDVLPDGKSLQ